MLVLQWWMACYLLLEEFGWGLDWQRLTGTFLFDKGNSGRWFWLFRWMATGQPQLFINWHIITIQWLWCDTWTSLSHARWTHLQGNIHPSSAWKSGPVRFFGPKKWDRDRDRSRRFLKPKRPDQDHKRPRLRSFSVFFGLWTGLGLNRVLAGSDRFLDRVNNKF